MPFSALLAAAAVAVTLPAEATLRRVPLDGLMGRSPAEVAAGLGLTGVDRLAPNFAALSGEEVVTVARADLRGPDDCDGYAILRRLESGGYVEYFVFRDARLVAVTHPAADPPLRPVASTPKAVRQELDAARKRPPGPLPLAAGVGGYLDQLQARALPTSESLLVKCAAVLHTPPAPPRRSVASDVLAAPFVVFGLAYWSPVYAAQAINKADRKATARENRPLTSQIVLGEPLPAGFRSRKGVRWHEDAPGYAVATLDLGALTGRDRDFEMFGVRDGRVEWIGTPEIGLCQDSERRPTAARSGCTETGMYRP